MHYRAITASRITLRSHEGMAGINVPGLFRSRSKFRRINKTLNKQKVKVAGAHKDNIALTKGPAYAICT